MSTTLFPKPTLNVCKVRIGSQGMSLMLELTRKYEPSQKNITDIMNIVGSSDDDTESLDPEEEVKVETKTKNLNHVP